jgi:hypothetical protein
VDLGILVASKYRNGVTLLKILDYINQAVSIKREENDSVNGILFSKSDLDL